MGRETSRRCLKDMCDCRPRSSSPSSRFLLFHLISSSCASMLMLTHISPRARNSHLAPPRSTCTEFVPKGKPRQHQHTHVNPVNPTFTPCRYPDDADATPQFIAKTAPIHLKTHNEDTFRAFETAPSPSRTQFSTPKPQFHGADREVDVKIGAPGRPAPEFS